MDTYYFLLTHWFTFFHNSYYRDALSHNGLLPLKQSTVKVLIIIKKLNLTFYQQYQQQSWWKPTQRDLFSSSLLFLLIQAQNMTCFLGLACLNIALDPTDLHELYWSLFYLFRFLNRFEFAFAAVLHCQNFRPVTFFFYKARSVVVAQITVGVFLFVSFKIFYYTDYVTWVKRKTKLVCQ